MDAIARAMVAAGFGGILIVLAVVSGAELMLIGPEPRTHFIAFIVFLVLGSWIIYRSGIWE